MGSDKILPSKIEIRIALVAVVAIAFGILFIGCSDGNSGGSTDVNVSGLTSSSIEGIFIDSPVGGINYLTDTHEGITDEFGRFQCFEGEMIAFMIGDVMLGQTLAKNIITPMDFLDESEIPFDVTHPMVTNMGRFLQSLDSDGDPENGITISQEVRDEITGRMIDFHQGIEDFENDPDVVACFDVLTGLDMPHNGFMWGLVPTEEARQHMLDHMGEYMEEHMGYDASEGSDGDFEHPMDEYMDDHMGEYMEEHMGYGPSEGSDEDFEHPMEEYMDNQMGAYGGRHMMM
jgi:hypothetical protein